MRGEPVSFWISGALLLSALLWLCWTFFALPPYTPDSWSYYELSTSVFTDFYRANTWRQYQFEGGYGVSFPPLWPVLIATFNAVFDLSWRGGFVLGFFVVAATAGVLGQLTHEQAGSRTLGVFVTAMLLLDPSYRSELLGGRSIPLSALFLFALFLLLMRSRSDSVRTPLATGLLAGLATLARFDVLLAGAAATLAVAWTGTDTKDRVQRAVLHGVAYLATLSPWMAYSWTHHGKLLVSDNSRTALSAVETFVSDYYLVAPPTLFDAPALWLSRYLAGAAVVTTALLPALVVAVMPFLGLAGLLCLLAHPRNVWDRFRALPIGNLWLPLPILAVQFLSVSLTGYPDRRYFSVLAATLSLLLFIGFARVMGSMIPTWALLVLALVVPETAGLQNMPGLYAAPIRTRVHRPSHARQHARIVRCLPDDARLLVLDGIGPYPFGALTGVETFTKPRNLSKRNVAPFVEQFGITHVLGQKKRHLNLARAAGPLERSCKREPVWRYK